MNKIIKHTWPKVGFLLWQCPTCGCMKQKVIGSSTQYFYFRNGEQLSELPECKSIYHCDKLPKTMIL